ncbi:hypothetical protein [Christiangramia sp. SM2212]|uniref:Uncharacterized protein n=1 Tax=Christiangramia sediminicola TaxID=3073267 RepID=A0ABU1EM47_9FLAO|nr:hypothetical protein [Christiangramia sp. SM2212]MDR5589451.1 hypothetical protein [Christiangramia sp. SM2212]
MDTTIKAAANFQEGMMVSELRQNTSVNFINTLRENDLIEITRKGEIRLTPKGRVASKFGVDNYLKMEKVEKEFFNEEINNMKVENRGLLMIFGGMFISLILIIGFWAIQLKGL